MAARTRRIFNDENTRAKIQTTQLIKRLTNHVLGTVELSASQVTAALGLMKKTLPDLSAIEHSGEIVHTDANELSDDQLLNIATAGSTGTTKQAHSKKQPNKVH